MTKRERLDSIATNGDLFPELTDEQKKENKDSAVLMSDLVSAFNCSTEEAQKRLYCSLDCDYPSTMPQKPKN